ncbi:MAG: SET domain-containing protein-lysine N-methyltransferase [Candidatus Peribacteraceae bacterium]|nr:SET domain-containing protein-lysine N-methyltransferase [Candidatus Peribacteraceae bacterium]
MKNPDVPGGRDDLLARIYTPLSNISMEISERRNNKALMKKVEDFFGPWKFDAITGEPRAVLSRSIATPNLELSYFLSLSNGLGMTPLILEYPDKFVAKNPDKYHLCKLFFVRKVEGGNPIVIDTLKLVNFNADEGKALLDIKTTNGENIVDFHHYLLGKQFPYLSDKVINFSDWFNNTRVLSRYYYLYFLSLFICHGVLFENYLIGDKEESSFFKEKFLPSFEEAERIFGVKPIIYSLLPFRYATRIRWYSYPESLKKYIAGSNHNNKLPTSINHFPELKIKDTGKYGMGVYANENIKKGTVIRVLDGEIISFNECIKRIKAGEEEQTDSLQVGLESDMDLDGLSRTFNHSCDPSAGLRKTSELIALRNIKIGEEITYDYSATVGPNIPQSLWEMECMCGSKKCRRTLGNILSVPKKQLEKYMRCGALQDYIKAELKIIQQLNGKLPKYRKISL